MTYYMKSSLRAPKYQETLTDFFPLEIHIAVRSKASPTREFRSQYAAPQLRYTTDILWAFSVVFIALLLLVILNKM